MGFRQGEYRWKRGQADAPFHFQRDDVRPPPHQEAADSVKDRDPGWRSPSQPSADDLGEGESLGFQGLGEVRGRRGT